MHRFTGALLPPVGASINVLFGATILILYKIPRLVARINFFASSNLAALINCVVESITSAN